MPESAASTGELVVRRASAADAAPLYEMWSAAHEEIGLASCCCDPTNRAEYIDWMTAACGAQDVLVAENAEDETLGFIMGNYSFGQIAYVVVAAPDRGRGVGTLLLTTFQHSATCKELRGEARNERSRRLMVRCGFELAGYTEQGFPVLIWCAPNTPGDPGRQ